MFHEALGAGDNDKIFGIFLLPIILSAYIGGLGPGIFAIILTALLTNVLLLHPHYTLIIASNIDFVRWIVMIIVGLLSCALSESLHRARRSAEEGQWRYAVTLSSIGDAVITTDAQGQVTFLNAEASRITGWEDDALGQPLSTVFAIINETTRTTVESPVTKVLQTGAVVGLANHTLLISRDGRETPIDDSGAPIIDRDGLVLGVVLVFRDVTEQRHAEAELLHSERLLKLFVDLAPAAIAMFDNQMRYIAVSRRFTHDYRLKTTDLIGRSHYEIFPEVPAHWREIHQRCLAGAIERCEEDLFPRLDGQTDWIRWEMHPWYEDATTVGGIVLFSEVILTVRLYLSAVRTNAQPDAYSR